ncbi:MAG: hypothetical protein J0I14_10110 [Propionibacteriaceae bacterium]|jgi:hypothetical protein|nr:hypothetical protein [Propionibacteriaceae bacterium]
MAVLELTAGPATPPWLPLAMVGVLLLLLGALYWSMSSHLKKIHFREQPEPGDAASPASGPSAE